jgi:RNA polymerase sigma-70 factor (ECF subfamily)
MERARAGAPLGIDSLEPVRLDARSGSLDRLFRVQAPQLLRYVSRRIAVRDEADDLVQESFLRLARATAGQDFPARPEAYLQRIARNLLRNRAKRAIARAEHLHAPLDEETLSSREPGPDGLLEFRELAARYENALNALSPKTRNVFLRHRRDGYTYAEIAEELNQTVSNVEKHMMKAIAHLDRVLGRPE